MPWPAHRAGLWPVAGGRPALTHSPIGTTIPRPRTMNELPMPSDVLKQAAGAPGAGAGAATPSPGTPSQQLVEPPSVKLIVRLFVIPLIIVALAVGVMFLISLMAGGTPTMEEALERL